jgi:hypothetical protein
MRLQRLQNWCIKVIFNLDKKHNTVDLYKNVILNTLPVIGVTYMSMIVMIKKSLTFETDLLPKYQLISNNTRQNGLLKANIFKRKNRGGNEASCLGVRIYNQLPDNHTYYRQLE